MEWEHIVHIGTQLMSIAGGRMSCVVLPFWLLQVSSLPHWRERVKTMPAQYAWPHQRAIASWLWENQWKGCAGELGLILDRRYSWTKHWMPCRSQFGFEFAVSRCYRIVRHSYSIVLLVLWFLALRLHFSKQKATLSSLKIMNYWIFCVEALLYIVDCHDTFRHVLCNIRFCKCEVFYKFYNKEATVNWISYKKQAESSVDITRALVFWTVTTL